MNRRIAQPKTSTLIPAATYLRPCPNCNAVGLVEGTRRALVENEWQTIPTKARDTCPTCKGLRFLDHPYLGGKVNEDTETVTLDGDPVVSEAPKAKTKAPKEPKPKAEKAPKEPRPSKFGDAKGDINEAIKIIDAAVAAGEPLGSSRTWTVAIGGHIVAPKWIVSKLTGKPTSEFVTGDAVKFLADMGLVAQKSEGAAE